jgi:hypothetical protein
MTRAPLYTPGHRLGQLELLSVKRVEGRWVWTALCSCGEVFKRRECRLNEMMHACRACAFKAQGRAKSARWEAVNRQRMRSKLCFLCGSQPHRAPVDGCKRCGLKRGEESRLELVECMRSSAGRWESAA